MYIRITRVKPRRGKISQAEFDITKQFIDMLELYVDDEYQLCRDTENLIGEPIECGSKILGFAERFSSISSIPRDLATFRPLRNEKHSDIIIELFEELGYIDFDTFEMNDYEKDGKIKYSGWFVKDGETVEGSFIKTSPSPSILKMSIIAALLMDEDEHKEYMSNLMLFLRKGGNVNDNASENI